MRIPVAAAIVLSLLVSACASTRSPPDRTATGPGIEPPDATQPATMAGCSSCGVVERIDRVFRTAEQTAKAATVLDGVVGQALDSERAGTGTAKAAVTGGATTTRTTPMYELVVRMDDGRSVVLLQRDLSGIREGAIVSIRDGRAHLQQ
jgi:outer membrane lipoprotein SlyB